MNARQHLGAGTSPVPAMTKECQVKDHDILCIGDVNVDLILAGVTRLPDFGEEVLAEAMGMHLGGCTANVATFAARLGLRSALRARVGEDDFGTFVLEGLAANGVSTAHIIRDGSLRTGLTVSISGPHDRAFVTCGQGDCAGAELDCVGVFCDLPGHYRFAVWRRCWR